MKTAKIRNITLGTGIPKICVPIVDKTEAAILRSAREVLDTGLDLIEWRADWYQDLEKDKCLEEILHKIRNIIGEVPLLFTVRTKAEGGMAALSDESYERLLVRAAKTGMADAVDLEALRDSVMTERVSRCLHAENVAVLGSNHDFEATPPQAEVRRRLLAMFDMGVDIAKIAVMPNSEQDVWNLMAGGHEAALRGRGPVVTMSMGERGVISRLSGEYTGSAMTFGAAGAASAPGQIPVETLRYVLNLLHEKTGNLFLIGFMGCGKSTIAGTLERLIGISCVEMDQVLVDQEQKSIADIFAENGEEYFRRQETQLLKSFADRSGIVVSCGGGVPLREENIHIMKKNGKVLFLDVDPEIIFQRVKSSTDRPLLNGHMDVDYIRELMEKRRPWYEKAADIIVKVRTQSALETCANILRSI